jgi:flagellar assembly protein FliH
MMISPFETADTIADSLTVRPATKGSQHEIARLAFYPLEKPVVEMATASELAETSPEAGDLKKELETLNARLQEQTHQTSTLIDKTRSEARAEARQEWDEELEASVAAERVMVRQICELFDRERSKYFAGVEAEIVKLSLAIAARILHREVKLDPLLLAGAVRVALGKIEDGSTTVLRVPAVQTEAWKNIFSESPLVQVAGDERLAVGEGVLETNVGRVELGVNAQLSEIERGFFDLLQQRPV